MRKFSLKIAVNLKNKHKHINKKLITRKDHILVEARSGASNL